jgi:hypothetical protein
MEETAPLARQKEVGMKRMMFTTQTTTRALPRCLMFRIVPQILLMEITKQTVKKVKSVLFRNAQRIRLKTDSQLHIL